MPKGTNSESHRGEFISHFLLLQYEVYSYLFQPLHMTIFGKQLNI